MTHVERIARARTAYEKVTLDIEEHYASKLAEIEQAIPEVPGDIFGRHARIKAIGEANAWRQQSLEHAEDMFRRALRATWHGHAEVAQR